ncbi:unnamed protein product [Prorocentrum cordatum]|uniref:Mei2-like C-terminal RNA recognition motif domain-containing protein n=1 Tax=Prorocentrum cordatum TaxID=2364126 RepID=A0ABN9X369_9DINO|nr:unnamed protein product [Polarella glacialis]
MRKWREGDGHAGRCLSKTRTPDPAPRDGWEEDAFWSWSLPSFPPEKVPALPWPPSQPCGPPSPQQRHALLVGCAAAPQRPLEGAGARTPLSSRSRPYVPWIPLGASAPEPKDSARPVGVDAKGEGGKVEAQSQSRPEGQTTVMLRGLPGSYSREQLVRLLDARGYSGLFNFVYLPVNFESSQAAGYAFINWTRADIAESFKESFEGLTCHPFSSSRPCSASWSRVQGLSANVKQYRNSPVMHEQVPDEYKPVLLWNGLRRAFPGPTTTLKELKKPRRTPCSECCPEGPAGQPLYLADA